MDEEGVGFFSLEKKKTYTFDEFILKMQSKKMSSPILPHGTVWFEANDPEKLHAIQIPPKKRTIPYYGKFYEIGFPSLVLLVKTAGTFVVNVALCVAMKPIRDFEDELFRLPLPNMDDRGCLCLGFSHDTQAAKFTTEVERIRYIVEHVETSKYNDHLLPLSDWVPPELRGSYKSGDQYSERDSTTTRKNAYNEVLENWSKLTEGSDWLKIVENIEWDEFKKFHSFIRGTL